MARMQLTSLSDFEYIGASSSSVFQVGAVCLQFYWHNNVLEEMEDFGFSYSGISPDQEKSLKEFRDSIKNQAPSFDQALKLLINSADFKIGLCAKYAFDEYFNYDVVAYQSDLLCRCFGIAKDSLWEDLKAGNSFKVQDWKDKYCVGMGCGTCGADVEEFFQRSFDNPPEQSDDFDKIRKSKTGDETVLIRPLGKTPFELIQFLAETLPIADIEVNEVSGYQVTLNKMLSDEELAKLKQFYLENYQVQFYFLA